MKKMHIRFITMALAFILIVSSNLNISAGNSSTSNTDDPFQFKTPYSPGCFLLGKNPDLSNLMCFYVPFLKTVLTTSQNTSQSSEHFYNEDTQVTVQNTSKKNGLLFKLSNIKEKANAETIREGFVPAGETRTFKVKNATGLFKLKLKCFDTTRSGCEGVGVVVPVH